MGELTVNYSFVSTYIPDGVPDVDPALVAPRARG
jgi:hypothetical protein